eukprot:12890726-Alexandrium_andersonii.AAC.1
MATPAGAGPVTGATSKTARAASTLEPKTCNWRRGPVPCRGRTGSHPERSSQASHSAPGQARMGTRRSAACCHHAWPRPGSTP